MIIPGGEITAAISGVIAGIGGAALMFKFLNAKIDKKQDKSVCAEIAKNFEKSINKSDERHEKVMEILSKIQIATGKIEQKVINGNG